MRIVASRRRGLAFLVITGLLAAACGDDTSLDTTTTTATASTTVPGSTTTSTPGSTTTTPPGPGDHPYGGEAVVGATEVPVTLNPYAPGGDSEIVNTLSQAYLVGVADIDGFTLELVPDVVVALPSIANGGLVINGDGSETVHFEIDPLAVWSDGTPISGEDFRFTYETLLATPGLVVDRAVYEDIIPASLVVGAKSFEFRLARPTLAVEAMFAVILPAHAVSGTDLLADWNDRMWPSGGPFEFATWTPAADGALETITFTRNDAYWKLDPETGQELPYLDEVSYRFAAGTSALVTEFVERRVDVIVPGADLEVLAGFAAFDGAFVDVVGDGQWEHLAFQFGDGRLGRNAASYNEFIEFRRAVAHAIDRDALATAMLGGFGDGMGLGSFLDAFLPEWVGEGWDRYPFDLAAAAEQLDLLCDRDGVDCAANPPAVVMAMPSGDFNLRLSEALAPMFAAAGIGFEAVPEPSLIFFGPTLDFGRFDLGQWSWKATPGIAALVGAFAAWDPGEVPPFGLAISRWGSPPITGQATAGYNQGASSVIDEYTRRYEIVASSMRFTADSDRLLDYFIEAEEILADEVVFIPLFQNPHAGVVWADEIGGYRHNYFAGDLWNVAQWYRADG